MTSFSMSILTFSLLDTFEKLTRQIDGINYMIIMCIPHFNS
jgi:hypothetical protein